jgi:hypothetical protein
LRFSGSYPQFDLRREGFGQALVLPPSRRDSA